MKKIFSLTFFAVLCSMAAFAITPIVGSTSGCQGTYGYVSDSLSPGGSWSTSNSAIATINNNGAVYGIAAGTVTITYTLGGSFVTSPYQVLAAPAPITGSGSSLCTGTTMTLADVTPGGTWFSSYTSIATVDNAGLVTGVAAGNVNINYTTGGSCYVSYNITVDAPNAGYISGSSTVCASGGTTTLVDSTSYFGTTGTWSSSNAAVASIDPATGVVTGNTVGTVTITYTANNGCGTANATFTLNVINTTNAGTISGTSAVTVGNTATLHATVSGGVWSSNASTIASINSSTGVYTGIAPGTASINYTVNGCGGSATATYSVSVNAFNGISGHVNFTSGGHYGAVTVYLITYNAGTQNLQLADSTVVYASGSSVYYQFTGVAADSYRVKAAVYDSANLTTGYIPTYHTSSFYWYNANVINHAAGGSDVNEDINMATGTPTSGPGFIGGSVVSGANKGTNNGVAGMNVYLFTATGTLQQKVQTDINGNYSFSNLPVGTTYYVFPEALNYMTTAYTGIALTSGATSMSAANFTQHTVSKTITPNATAVSTLTNNNAGVIAFPNPAANKLNLQWQLTNAENGTISIADITGREVYNAPVSMNAGTGVSQVDLSSFTNGLYIVTVKSGSINYNTKIQVQH